MKKSTKRILSLFLVLMMVVSLFPTAYAAETGEVIEDEGYGSSWEDWDVQPAEEGAPIEEEPTDPFVEEPVEEPAPVEEPVEEPAPAEEPVEEPVVEETPAIEEEESADEEEEEESFPANTFYFVSGDGLRVTVDAPEGAFPADTEMNVSELPAAYVQDVVAASGVEGEVLVAADISFANAEGALQPNGKVKVSITSAEAARSENVKVVHIDDDQVVSEVNQLPDFDGEVQAFRAAASDERTLKFEADSFSVYAIIGDPEGDDGQPYRMTYEFYNADGSPYEFKNTAGETQTSQILKNDEILEDVGIPTQGASQNAKFVGWYVWNADDTFGEKVEVGEAKSVGANGTIRLKAKMQGIVNVFFVTAVMKDDQGQDMERSIVTIKQVEFTVGQEDPITVDVNDVTTDAPTAEQAVVGWNRNEAAANDGTAEGTDGVITLYADTTGEITDVMMFPAIQDAAWLFFDENDGGTGGGASYTPPVFVTVGGKPVKPADPHRAGYEFDGWYKDADCTQAFDFNQPLNATTTVYAKWVGAATTYTIIVWVQRTADSASLPNNGQNRPEGERTYDFHRSYTVNSTTGASATATSASMSLGNTLDADGHIKYNRNDGPKTVEANGSTVINVYYDRDVMTIHFKVRQNDRTDTYATWYGLYDATFNESGKTWPVVSNRMWTSESYRYTFMDAFVDFDTRTATSLTLWQVEESDSYYDYIFQKETLTSGQYVTANSSARTGSLKLSEKYTGFTLYRYRNGTSGSWNYTNGTYPSVPNAYNDLYIQYQRNTYNLVFQNSIRGTAKEEIRSDSVKYEAPLAGYSVPADPTYPVAADADHFEFIGWFADTAWTTLVSFKSMTEAEMQTYRDYYGVSSFIFYTSNTDTMPAHNLVLYAGYTLKGWDCALDPNGGELTDAGQAGVFWLAYGEKISSAIKTHVAREGYVFQGWMVANVSGDLNVVTRDGKRFVGDDSNWTMTDTPWQFDQGITGPTYLMAKWFYKSAMSVVYDANGGSNAPTDEGSYSDGATTVAFRAPTPPEDKFFIGWDIVGTETEEHLQPGATFEVSSDYAVDGVVTLKAIYNATGTEEEVPATHIDWYANNTETGEYTIKNEDGTESTVTMGKHVSDTGIQLNEAVGIKPSSTFSNFGYAFIGWAKLHETDNGMADHNGNAVAAPTDGSVMDYALTEDNLYLKFEDGKFFVDNGGTWTETSYVAADEKLPYDDMYAVWVEEYFYVYHSATGMLEAVKIHDVGEGLKYNLTAKVPSDTHLYGGYYAASGCATAENVEDAKADAVASLKAGTAGGAAVTGAKIYDGTNLLASPKSGDTPAVRFWNKADAAKVLRTDESGTDTAAVAAGSGDAVTPQANDVFYLKEVPNLYLEMDGRYVYDWNQNNEILKMYLMTVVDDTYYSKIGYVIVTAEKTATVVGKFSYQQRNSTTATSVIPADLVGQRGYIGVVDDSANLISSIVADTVTVIPFWYTLDGVRITTAGADLSCSGGDKLTSDNFVCTRK